MSKIAGRRPNQLCNLVRVLEFGAVNFDHRIGLGEQDLSGGFDHARLARTGWSQEKHRPDWPAGVLHSGKIYLIKAGYPANCPLLPDNQRAELSLELLGPWALHVGIQRYAIVRSFSNFVHVFHSKLRKAGAQQCKARSALASLPTFLVNKQPVP